MSERNRGVASALLARGCCAAGTYECQVPMAIAGHREDIDACIADIVAALNAANIPTVASCCGHGRRGTIALADGRELIVANVQRVSEP